jgi:hypothetical protein
MRRRMHACHMRRRIHACFGFCSMNENTVGCITFEERALEPTNPSLKVPSRAHHKPLLDEKVSAPAPGNGD